MVDPNQIPNPAEGSDPKAVEYFVLQLYDELHELARREIARERPDHTLQATALVNEAYLRLAQGPGVQFADRAVFFAAAANAIRRVLVDHARRRGRDKRGGGMARVALEGLDLASPLADQDLLALDEALERLANFDPLKARLVELRFFAGFSELQLAEALGASESTVRREWRLARAWLRTQLEGPHEA